MEYLFNPDLVITLKEIQEAVRFMLKYGIPLSEASLSKVLGGGRCLGKKNGIKKHGEICR